MIILQFFLAAAALTAVLTVLAWVADRGEPGTGVHRHRKATR